MSVEPQKIFINITHFVNPHLFWFKNKNEQDDGVEELERTLKRYVAESGDRISAAKNWDELKHEQYVAVRWLKKWVRAEIDVYDENGAAIGSNEAIVWITDYGYPLKISLDSMVLLSAELKQLCRSMRSAVIQAGIASIKPAEKRVNVNKVLYSSFQSILIANFTASN